MSVKIRLAAAYRNGEVGALRSSKNVMKTKKKRFFSFFQVEVSPLSDGRREQWII